MKHNRYFLVLFFLAFFFAANAQFAPINGYWEGLWSEYLPCHMSLITEPDGQKVTGTITYIFETSQQDGTITREESKEYLEGHYNTATGVLILKTVAEEDTPNLVVPGVYQFKMDQSGVNLTGSTQNIGSSSTYRLRMSRQGA
jgi:hypothetical protein